VPLVVSTGAGAEMRHAMGVAVFSGMLGVTFFGLFLTPVFYVLLREMEKRVARGSVAGGSQSNAAAHYLLPVNVISPPLERALLNCSPYIRDWDRQRARIEE
jgi:hypothetical protein